MKFGIAANEAKEITPEHSGSFHVQSPGRIVIDIREVPFRSQTSCIP